ncbi:MAG: BamA/OMP85 family outer membrane protein [Verrucomicrobiota bacterium]
MASWLLLGAWSLAMAAEPPPPAQLKISGFGFFGDLRLKQMLTVLQPGKTRPEFFSASYIEDAALLLTSRLRNDGYLQPVITADLTLVDGRRISFVWDQNATQLLPRPLSVRKAHFKIDEGVLSYFDRLEFSGLEAIPEKKARRYFIETVGLFSLKQNRIYSPDKFDRGLRNLQEELQRMGFRDATVTAAQLERDDRTGKVDAVVQVKQGPQYVVDSVRLEVYFEDNAPVVVRTNRMNRAFSEWWKSDYAVGIKTNLYHFGYPDTAVEMTTLSQISQSNEVHLAMEAVVKTGPIVQTGTVELNGNQHTKESVLRRRVPLHEGDLLDRIKAERSRYRLSRLGVFDSVELKYEKVDEHTRNIIYDLKEGKRIGVSLLIGYGSYEQLRGGVQLDQYNVFGRAHHQQLKLTQSFKSSNADYLYTMPEFFGENVDVFVNGSGLRREEISFTRLEYGGGAGLRKYFRGVNTDMSMRYNYQILEANGAQTNFFQDSAQNSGVGAIITDINHDRRDNPLYPHRGYRFFSSIEIASEYLASEVNYQRLDLSLS